MNTVLAKEWKKLGALDPKSLKPAVEQIHHGVQFVSMVGKYFVENQPDDSHTNMEWIVSDEVLAGNWVKAPKGNFRLAMRPKDLALVIYDSGMNPVDQCTLNGISNLEACRWLEEHLDRFGEDSTRMNLMLHYEIPNHETDQGEAYRLFDPPLFEEMTRYRANSDMMLRHFASQYKTASEVRTWPHHFDNGAYIPMVFGKDGEHLKSFSIGLGIPDEASDEPYFYITTWSKAGDNSYDGVETLPVGQWIKAPFTGAILKASEITAKTTEEEQASLVYNFLEKGIAASLKVIGR